MAGEMWDLASRPLGIAILEDDLDAFKDLVKDCANTKVTDRKGNTFLHLIATTYSPRVFHSLVSTGIDVQAQNKHGNTALHVSAAQNEGGHVCDLLMSGVDPTILNAYGQRARDISSVTQYWKTMADHYEPGLFKAIETHDVERVEWLLRQWCRTDICKDGRSARQFAARLGHHDLVSLIDRYKPPLDLIYSLLEVDTPKLRAALNRGACDLNFCREGTVRTHPLQLALRLGPLKHVQLLCRPPLVEIPRADVNSMVKVLGYYRGPLYFEALAGWRGVSPEGQRIRFQMVDALLNSGANLKLKDSNARTFSHFLVERLHSQPECLTLIERCLQRGADIGDREGRGLTLRNVAELWGRRDVVQLVDWHLVCLIRDSDLRTLRRLVVGGYRDLWFELRHRDTKVYAAGNDDEQASDFLVWAATFITKLKEFHRLVVEGRPASDITTTLDVVDSSYREERRKMERQRRMHFGAGEETWDTFILEQAECYLLGKDAGGRCSLHLAVLADNEEAAETLWRYQGRKDDEEREAINFLSVVDNFGRNPLHYAYCVTNSAFLEMMKSGEKTRAAEQVVDVFGRVPSDYRKLSESKRLRIVDEERNRSVGMERNLKLIRAHTKIVDLMEDEDLPKKDKYEMIKSLLKKTAIRVKTLEDEVMEMKPDAQLKEHPHSYLLASSLERRQWDIAQLLVYHGANPERLLKVKVRDEIIETSAIDFCRKMGVNAIADYMMNQADVISSGT